MQKDPSGTVVLDDVRRLARWLMPSSGVVFLLDEQNRIVEIDVTSDSQFSESSTFVGQPFQIWREKFTWLEVEVIPFQQTGQSLAVARSPANEPPPNRQNDSDHYLGHAEHLAQLGCFDWDIQGNTIRWSDGLFRIYGLKPQEFEATLEAFLDRVVPEDRAEVMAQVNDAIERCGSFSSVERILHTSGEIRWLESRGQVITDEQGQPARLMGVCRDVSERWLVEQAKASQIEGLKLLANSASEFMTNRDDRDWVPMLKQVSAHLGCEAFANFEFIDDHLQLVSAHGFTPETAEELKQLNLGEQMCGVCAQERSLLYTPFGELQSHPQGNTLIREGFRTFVGVPLITEGRLLGTVSFVSKTREKLTESEIDYVQTVGQLIGAAWALKYYEAERKELGEKLQHAQKMEAVGRLAGGVAHDFNNLLTVINTYVEILQDQLVEGQSLSGSLESVKAIRGAADRATNLTRQLLVFGRSSNRNRVTVDLNATIQGSLSFLRQLAGEQIQVTTKLTADSCTIQADPGHLDQVLVNLTANARDAMPEGGELELSTHKLTIANDAKLDVKPGEYVELRVKDNGCGMSDMVKDMAFEPFFTSKPVGKGTGLGLAVVYGVVQECRGSISVSSNVGQGTEFRLLFPMAVDAPAVRVDTAPISSSPSDARILLVEDNDDVRRAAREALEMNGYDVLEAVDARQAVEFTEMQSEAFDLLLTDIVMPDMNGLELASKVQSTNPNISVLCMSGYHKEASDRPESYNFLQKPFTFESLVQAVQKTLEKRLPDNAD